MWLIDFDKRLTSSVFVANKIPEVWEQVIYLVASSFVYALPVILLFLFFIKRDFYKSGKIFVGIMLAWQIINRFLSLFFYNAFHFRDRPFADRGIQEFFFEQPHKSFPSDHATALLAATLLFFWYKYPKIGWVFVFGTVFSGLARVMMGFHYFGDILAGFVVGLLGAYIVLKLDRVIGLILNAVFRWIRIDGLAKDI